MRFSRVQAAAMAFLLVGCTQQGTNGYAEARGARAGQGQFAGYDAFRPQSTDSPEVVHLVEMARADRDAATNAFRMGNRAAAMQLSTEAMAELQQAQNMRREASYPSTLELLREVDSGQIAEKPDLTLVEARELLGEFYENGWGVPQNYAMARHWYQKAVDTPEGWICGTKSPSALGSTLGPGPRRA